MSTESDPRGPSGTGHDTAAPEQFVCPACGNSFFDNDGCPDCTIQHTALPAVTEAAPARPYATENGFYLGDAVRRPDGRKGRIDEIVVQHCSFLTSFGTFTGSVVRLDDEFWMDGALARA